MRGGKLRTEKMSDFNHKDIIFEYVIFQREKSKAKFTKQFLQITIKAD